jgi:hypothetical protein
MDNSKRSVPLNWDRVISVLAGVIAAASFAFAYYQYHQSEMKSLHAQAYAGFYLGTIYVTIDEELHTNPLFVHNLDAANDYLHTELKRYKPMFDAASIPIDPTAYVVQDMDPSLRPSTWPDGDFLSDIIINTMYQVSTDTIAQSSFNYASDIEYLKFAEPSPDFGHWYKAYQPTINTEAKLMKDRNCAPLPSFTNDTRAKADVDQRSQCYEARAASVASPAPAKT